METNETPKTQYNPRTSFGRARLAKAGYTECTDEQANAAAAVGTTLEALAKIMGE
jgi:hypothetical protein